MAVCFTNPSAYFIISLDICWYKLVAWMPAEISPAHNIWGWEVRSGLDLLWSKYARTNQIVRDIYGIRSIQLSADCRGIFLSWFSWNMPHNHSPMEQYQTHILNRTWVWWRQATNTMLVNWKYWSFNSEKPLIVSWLWRLVMPN